MAESKPQPVTSQDPYLVAAMPGQSGVAQVAPQPPPARVAEPHKTEPAGLDEDKQLVNAEGERIHDADTNQLIL